MKKNIIFHLFFMVLTLISFDLKGQNYSLNFDGIDDYVNVNVLANQLSGLSNFSIEFWLKADANAQGSVRTVPFAHNLPSGGDNKFLIVFGGIVNASEGKIMVYDEGGGFEIISTTFVGDNNWHHIAYTREFGIGELYIDGINEGIHISNNPFAATDRYSFGQEYDGNSTSDYLNGSMDDIRIWSISKSQTDIQNNMNTELTGTESELISYYKMDNPNSNCDVVDCNSNENHGTRFGAGGANNFPQYLIDTPTLTDIPCGVPIICSPFPVELIDFIGIQIEEHVELNWSTANEINNNGFQIEKSNNTINWEIIDFVAGHGTTTQTNEYQTIDLDPFLGINYYRLTQIDHDGLFAHSKTISINIRKEVSVEVYPNPTTEKLNFNGSNVEEILIRNSVGKVIMKQWISDQIIDISELSSGLYYISLKTNNELITKRIMKN